MRKVTFVVAERSYLIRRGLVSSIEELGNTSVVRELDSGERLVKILTDQQPDYLIIAADLLQEFDESIRCLFESGFETQLVVLLNSGDKISTHYHTSDTIFVADDKTTILRLLRELVARQVKLMHGEPHSAELSPRELNIVRDISLGLSNKEIAEKNFISFHTVATHRKNITRKLGIKSVPGLTVYAILNKLIDMDALS
ncbi:MAG TPA: response regulator transcription factor [Williamwhitmania sp.]|nr:response regulator transcription factor [Williamwhitmania sp.]